MSDDLGFLMRPIRAGMIAGGTECLFDPAGPGLEVFALANEYLDVEAENQARWTAYLSRVRGV